MKHRRTLVEQGLIDPDQAEALARSLVAAALDGDRQAAAIIADRLWPKLRPIAPPVEVHIPAAGSLSEAGLSILRAAASGQIGTDAAHDLIGSLGALARLAEFDEIRTRLERLEGLTHEQR